MSLLAIVGETGTGKSTSFFPNEKLGIIGLNPTETVIISPITKDLPFKNWKSYYNGSISAGGNLLVSKDAEVISKAILHISSNRPDIKNIVIDDMQYVMALEFIRRSKENGYGKFAELGQQVMKIIDESLKVRPDLNIIFLWHPEFKEGTGYKMKTVG